MLVAGDMVATPKTITYYRGYGNIIKHTMNPDNSLTSQLLPFNRIEPLAGAFGDGQVMPPVGSADIPMMDSSTKLAWRTTSQQRSPQTAPTLASASMSTQY
jgi:hypothetical protein